MAQWTFGRRVVVGFTVAGVIAAVIAGVGYVTIDGLLENEKKVAYTHEVRRDLAGLLRRLGDAESGQRGFVITGDESFLEPYSSALPEIERLYGRLRELLADNPLQSRRLEAMRPHVDAKLAWMRRPIDVRRSGGFEPAQALTLSGEGKRLMEEIRRLHAELDAEEVRLLDLRAREAESSAATAKAVMLLGAVLGFVLVMIIGWTINRALSRQIGDAVRHVQTSSTELHAAASQQAAGSKEQATAMSEITTTISELLATSRQIAESAQRVAQIAAETASAARSGTGTVDRTQEAVTLIRRQVDQIVGHMLELGKNSQQIGTIADIVGELAEQTNILAINATIEAAGAGEAGKRFAVVADEIRKLADRVGASTKEIRTLIDGVRSSVNTTVMTTETGSKAVDAGGKQYDEMAAAFRQIATLVQTTTEAAREIELSTKQQATAVEQVNVAIANVGQATRETEVSSNQTLDTAVQLTTLSKNLLRVVQANA
jgi:methyl-accepting chemotaxis protein